MRLFARHSVYDAALDRMRYLFDEFPNLYVNFSGGKDSTVILNLALQVAEEKGRLPLPVRFIDQEAEWACVIDYVRSVMQDQRVKPLWYQMPIGIDNATSHRVSRLQCWQDGADWMRPKEPDSIHANIFGTDWFTDLFGAILRTYHPDEPACALAGVRCQESPARARGLTSYLTYKGITWGRAEDKKRGHYTFYPIYDWSYTDVWKAIHDHGWRYCTLYDAMYQRGVPVQKMRVSNVHHETAVQVLFIMQEIEPDTWDRVTARLPGINTAGQMQRGFFAPQTLPFMFKDWREYRDHLLDNLILDPAVHDWMRRQFDMSEQWFEDSAQQALIKCHIAMVLTNDHTGVKLSSFNAAHGFEMKKRGRISGRDFTSHHDGRAHDGDPGIGRSAGDDPGNPRIAQPALPDAVTAG